MLAIIMESLLLETSIRIFGRTYLGFIIGSMLAMSWNLFQKIFNMIIFYGGNLVDIYKNITDYASRQLNLQFDAFWAPLILLLGIYALFGAVTAVAGIITGRKISSLPPEGSLPEPAVIRASSKKPDTHFDYSIGWLTADILLVAGMLVIVSLLNWIWWVIAVIPLITILALRYKRAMRQLSKPGFWITFVIITMLSALAFTAFQPGKNDLTNAILIGIQMNFRAVIIIVGFSALGTELYNPKIRSVFSRTYFRQLPVALELSAASLPTMIADMPDLKTAFKSPVSILNRMITRVERRLTEIRYERIRKRKIYIITGAIGEGKTAWLVKLCTLLNEKGIKTGGILALRIIQDGITTGYDISDISSGVRKPFLRLTGSETIGVERFTVSQEGVVAGQKALDPYANSDMDMVIVDEAGPLELRGQGWSNRIEELLQNTSASIIIAVRNNLTGSVIERFGITEAQIIDVGTGDPWKIAEEIVALRK
jgi:nucleoside-triphosphatase THEP1